MECVLSLINIPDEALHEADCTLKKGGKLEDLMCDVDFNDKKNKIGYFLLVAQKPE